MGAWTWVGAGASVGRGSCGGFTRVWLAESMVASVLSPCRGTSGMVPNFCLARSEEERRRMITGRRSSCCAQGQGREQGHAGLPCQLPPVPAQPSWVAWPACTHLSLEDAGGPVPQLSLPRAHQVPAEESAEKLPGSRPSGAHVPLSPLPESPRLSGTTTPSGAAPLKLSACPNRCFRARRELVRHP